MVIFSRRDIFRLGASLLARPETQRGAAQTEARGELSIKLVQEFARSSLKAAASPDGKKVCLEDWAERGYPLRVVEIGTWRTLYTGHFSSRIRGAASFFADSESLLVSAFASASGGTCGIGKGHCADRQIVVDIRTGERVEGVLPFTPDQYDSYYALTDRTLLGIHYEGKPFRTESLALVEFPSYRDLTKVPYATQLRKPRPVVSGIELSTDYGSAISVDRQKLAYAFDDVLVCRRTTDLKVLWTRSIEAGMKPFRVDISASGSHVAVAVADGEPILNQQHRTYIAIFDGETGKEVARLARN